MHTELFNYLQEALNAKKFNGIKQALDLSNHKWTGLLNNTRTLSKDEIIQLSKYLDMPLETIIFDYKVGWNLFSLDEISKIVNDQGLDIGLVQNAA